MNIYELSRLASGRGKELFLEDLAEREDQLRRVLQNKRILVIGGAGSIGSATVSELCRRGPAAVHVVDQNENGLAELVRDLRSGASGLSICDFRTLPLDFGSGIMQRFLETEAPYDLVLNFAALKHVRSEKDVWSLLQILDTNVVKLARLLNWLRQRGGPEVLFCVSTDKAANPVNLMGASKRLMEHVMFSPEFGLGPTTRTVSSRFANVAFSDGSLLQSWLKRLEKRQPLTVPGETKRFFISLNEAGRICLLAAGCAPSCHLLVPRLDPSGDLLELRDVLDRVLRHLNLSPVLCQSEEEARTRMNADLGTGKYPMLVTRLDTSGEKSFEEFIGKDEQVVEVGMRELLAVPYQGQAGENLARLIRTVGGVLDGSIPVPSKAALIEDIARILPELAHAETGRNLDQRM